jgi:hypothetical protein
MLASVSTMSACTMIAVVPEYTMYGNNARTTTTTRAPAPVHATFRRDRVTFRSCPERTVASVVTLTTATSAR